MSKESKMHCTKLRGGCCIGARCEFTIGPGIDGQPVVGFCLGAYKDGVTAVAPPEDCPHISAIAVRYAGLLQAFLRSRSRLPIWDKRLNRGALPSSPLCHSHLLRLFLSSGPAMGYSC